MAELNNLIVQVPDSSANRQRGLANQWGPVANWAYFIGYISREPFFSSKECGELLVNRDPISVTDEHFVKFFLRSN